MIDNALIKIAHFYQHPPAAVAIAKEQIGNLPLIARLGVYGLAIIFSGHAWLDQTPPVPAWQNSSLTPCSKFIALCDSLLSFANYSLDSPSGKLSR